MKKIAIISFIILGLFLAGCTGGGGADTSQVSGGSGVDITNFYIECEEEESGKCTTVTKYSGQPLMVKVTVKNKAPVSVERVYTELYNIDEFVVNQTKSPLKKTWPQVQPDTELDISWYIEVKDDLKYPTTYHPVMRTCYSFTTGASKDIFFADRDWSGEAPSLETYSSEGPLGITFSWQKNDIPLRGEGMKTIKIQVNKLINGFVANGFYQNTSYGDNKDTLYDLKLWWDTGNNFLTVSNEGDFGSCTQSGIQGTYECAIQDPTLLKLYNGKERSFQIFLDVNPATTAYEKVIKLHAEAKYKFCVTSNPLTVQAQPLT